MQSKILLLVLVVGYAEGMAVVEKARLVRGKERPKLSITVPKAQWGGLLCNSNLQRLQELVSKHESAIVASRGYGFELGLHKFVTLGRILLMGPGGSYPVYSPLRALCKDGPKKYSSYITANMELVEFATKVRVLSELPCIKDETRAGNNEKDSSLDGRGWLIRWFNSAGENGGYLLLKQEIYIRFQKTPYNKPFELAEIQGQSA